MKKSNHLKVNTLRQTKIVKAKNERKKEIKSPKEQEK